MLGTKAEAEATDAATKRVEIFMMLGSVGMKFMGRRLKQSRRPGVDTSPSSFFRAAESVYFRGM